MDQHRDVLTADGRREATFDWQAEVAQFQDSLDELHKLVDRLSVMEPEYQEMNKCAQRNLQEAYVLKREIDTFAISLELALIPR